jgi:hypothetical protein
MHRSCHRYAGLVHRFPVGVLSQFLSVGLALFRDGEMCATASLRLGKRVLGSISYGARKALLGCQKKIAYFLTHESPSDLSS